MIFLFSTITNSLSPIIYQLIQAPAHQIITMALDIRRIDTGIEKTSQEGGWEVRYYQQDLTNVNIDESSDNQPMFTNNVTGCDVVATINRDGPGQYRTMKHMNGGLGGDQSKFIQTLVEKIGEQPNTTIIMCRGDDNGEDAFNSQCSDLFQQIRAAMPNNGQGLQLKKSFQPKPEGGNNQTIDYYSFVLTGNGNYGRGLTGTDGPVDNQEGSDAGSDQPA
jgi:hypothetical protein